MLWRNAAAVISVAHGDRIICLRNVKAKFSLHALWRIRMKQRIHHQAADDMGKRARRTLQKERVSAGNRQVVMRGCQAVFHAEQRSVQHLAHDKPPLFHMRVIHGDLLKRLNLR